MSSDLGKLVLRLSLGLMILLHGIAKVTKGVGPIVGMVQKAGLPGWVAYLVLVGEILAPLLVILGLWTRPAAAVIAINMVVAVALAHTAQLLQLGQTGGWALELQGMFLFTAIALALLGGGKYGVGGRWN